MSENGINVLSLCDGISCGRIALDRSGHKVNNYYAAEIDKYANQISNKNYPNIERIGDVTKLSGADFKDIDVLLCGAPCQGFSFAGKRLNFDDPRSRLILECIRIKEETNPRFFLFENTPMAKESEEVITEMLGVKPIRIDSSLVSAQTRKRLYWTNIPGIKQPREREASC